jgi:EAL domain-containing protein (putative c-di-GMP-specific phosphodiesterase class I)
MCLAGSMSLKTVSEGVETAEQAEALAGFGCDGAQGFHYSRPFEPAAMTALLDR